MAHSTEVQKAVQNDDHSIMMCCGHDPTTKITSLAFQPDGECPLLATVSTTGKLALFNSKEFRRGGVCGPYATAHLNLGLNSSGSKNEEGSSGSSGSDRYNINNALPEEFKVLWISGNRLLVVIPGGDLVFYSVSGPETLQNNQQECSLEFSATATAFDPSSPLPPVTECEEHEEENDEGDDVTHPGDSNTGSNSTNLLRALSVGKNLNTSPSFDHTACVEYVSSPLTPPRGSDAVDSLAGGGVTIGGLVIDRSSFGRLKLANIIAGFTHNAAITIY